MEDMGMKICFWVVGGGVVETVVVMSVVVVTAVVGEGVSSLRRMEKNMTATPITSTRQAQKKRRCLGWVGRGLGVGSGALWGTGAFSFGGWGGGTGACAVGVSGSSAESIRSM
jgi:hypothetical protein